MESSGTADAIRREEGNLRYEYFIPMQDEKTVLLIDSWENQQALDVHHASPMMQTIAALRDKYDLHMRVERYVSDDETTQMINSFENKQYIFDGNDRNILARYCKGKFVAKPFA